MKKHKKVQGILYNNGITDFTYVDLKGGYKPYFVSYESGSTYIVELYSNTPETLNVVTGSSTFVVTESGETFFASDKTVTTYVNTMPVLKNASGIVSISGVSLSVGDSTKFSDYLYSYLGEDASYLVFRILNLQDSGTTIPVLVSVTVNGASAVVVGSGTSAYTAQGTYDNGDKENLTDDVKWASSNAAVATISSTGTLTAVAPGSTTLSATAQKLDGSTLVGTKSVTVPSLTSITVTGATSVITGTTNVAYSATGVYSDTNRSLNGVAAWASSNTSVATINSSTGILTALSATGTTNITASFNGVTSSNYSVSIIS